MNKNHYEFGYALSDFIGIRPLENVFSPMTSFKESGEAKMNETIIDKFLGDSEYRNWIGQM
jgi:hypothetical protein